MNYFNGLIVGFCGIVFSAYFLLRGKKREWKGAVVGLICISLIGYYMLDFSTFLKGGIEKKVRVMRLAQGGYRFPVTNIVTDRNEKYWASMALYNRKIKSGDEYVIYYLPNTKSVIEIKKGETSVYSYKQDYWVSILIISITGIVIAYCEFSLRSRNRKGYQ